MANLKQPQDPNITPNTPTIAKPAALVGVLGAGVLLVVLADPFPHLVNGLLVLILAGVILTSETVWIPWLNGAAAAFKG